MFCGNGQYILESNSTEELITITSLLYHICISCGMLMWCIVKNYSGTNQVNFVTTVNGLSFQNKQIFL